MAKKTNFEKNINELTEIVHKMENDEIDIDESIKLYKKGLGLANTLSKSLQEIEKEIFELKRENDILLVEKSDID